MMIDALIREPLNYPLPIADLAFGHFHIRHVELLLLKEKLNQLSE